MSLSVDEKIRVAHALDDLGVHLIEAGFPASNPKEAALFDLLSGESFSTSAIAAFGMTRRRDRTAEQDEGLRALAESFAPVCTLVGKTWSLHLEKVTQVDPEENLRMIADSVGFLAGQGKRVIYDAEHFFDAFRDDQDYAIRCLRAAAEAGAENVTLCDTNGSSLPAEVSAATSRVAVELGDSVQVGIHTHDDAGCAVANSLVAVEAGARLVQGTMNGYGERCGNANLISIIPALELKLGMESIGRDAPSAAHGDRSPGRRALQRHAEPEPALRGRQRVRPQGRHARGRGEPRRSHLRARRPRGGRRRPARARVRAVRQGHGPGSRGRGRPDRRPRDRPRQGAREPRLPVRGGRRLVRPADPQGDRRLRAAVPARVVAGDRGEARGRPRGDRGHDQDLGGRGALRAHRRGERPRERARQGAPGRDRRALPAPPRHGARELQGAHPRRAQGHGRRHARAARHDRRPGHLGRHRRVREHHRGELGSARGLPRGRDAAVTGRARAAPRPS